MPTTAASPASVSFPDRCAAVVARFQRDPDASARSLLVTVIGDSIRPRGGEVGVGSLARLVEGLNISERLVRTTLNRLVGDGMLATRRAGRRSFYFVTGSADREFAQVEDRIYHRRRDAWDGTWTIVVETDGLPALQRSELRRRLGWLGFAALVPGVQMCPVDRMGDVGEVLDDLGAGGRVAAFRSQADGVGLDDRTLARRTSDLDGLAPACEDFLARFASLAEGAAPRRDGIDPETAFLARTLLLHNWRRIALREPALPAPLWPDGWVGDTAYDVAAAAYRRLTPAAEAHLAAVVDGPAGFASPLAPPYDARFPRL